MREREERSPQEIVMMSEGFLLFSSVLIIETQIKSIMLYMKTIGDLNKNKSTRTAERNEKRMKICSTRSGYKSLLELPS